MPIAVTNPFAVIEEIASKSAAVGELFASHYNPATVSATTSFPVFVAPFALQVKQIGVMVWSANIAVSDTNYWRFAARRSRANVEVEFASKSTQLTGGEAISARTEWNFDAVTFNANSLIAKGDSVGFAIFATGAPTAMVGIVATFRYEPV
jgi:hypothetical protein